MPKKLLLFDFDGTIADTLPIIVRIVNEYGPGYGVKAIDKQILRALQDMTPKQVLEYFKVPIYKLPFFLNKIRTELFKDTSAIKVFPGIEKAILDLKKSGFNLAILTSSPKENVELFLEEHDLRKFDFIYSNKNIFGKPLTFRSIMRQNRLLPQDILYIGDEVRDIEACRKVHIQIISVTWGFNSRKILLQFKPDALVDAPGQLPNVVKSLS